MKDFSKSSLKNFNFGRLTEQEQQYFIGVEPYTTSILRSKIVWETSCKFDYESPQNNGDQVCFVGIELWWEILRRI